METTNGTNFLSLIADADWVVQLVILLLIFASVFSWAVGFFKWLQFRRVEALNLSFIKHLSKSKNFSSLYGNISSLPDCPASRLFQAAMQEWEDMRDKTAVNRDSFEGRILPAMAVSWRRDIIRLETYLTSLATIGSSAPFIGLFGTVWGIMNSFRAIAETQQSHLAIVAPGIAEALFATALGLFAAIPATVFYNYFSSSLKKNSALLENFGDHIELVLARHSR